MRSMLVLALQVLYTIGVLGLALYGFQSLWLTWKLLSGRWQFLQPLRPNSHFSRYFFDRPKPPALDQHRKQHELHLPQPDHWPMVTIQLPIYNERYVIERLIDACAKLTYPADKLQIQIL